MSAKGKEANVGGTDYAPLAHLPITPSLTHCVYTLIGFAWPAYGIVFLILLCSRDWFALSFPIQWLFPLVCLLALLLGHLTAVTLESRAATEAFYFFRRGMPLVFYRRFALVQMKAEGSGADPTKGAEPLLRADPEIVAETIEGTAVKTFDRGQPAIVFGAKRILLAAVDELHLTFLGMLEIKSYAASGKVIAFAAEADNMPLNKADLLARVPIGGLTIGDQKRLVKIFRDSRPGLTVNRRLDDRLNSPIVKGQVLIQAMGAVVLLYALFDVSYATFTWLEMLKDYYGSQLCLRHPDKAQAFIGAAGQGSQKLERATAQDLYNKAEKLRTHPLAFSWAYRALFANGNSAAQLLAIRAETLYWLGRRDEAVEVLKNALLLKPAGYKIQLQLARMLTGNGSGDEARQVLDKVLDKHKDVLMPRIYNCALVLHEDAAARLLYKRYLAELDEEVFGDEPGWPPGSEKPLLEMWRRDDLEFLAPYFIFSHEPGQFPSKK